MAARLSGLKSLKYYIRQFISGPYREHSKPPPRGVATVLRIPSGTCMGVEHEFPEPGCDVAYRPTPRREYFFNITNLLMI